MPKGIDSFYGNFYSGFKRYPTEPYLQVQICVFAEKFWQERFDMGFFSYTGKKKKKEQTKFQAAEAEWASEEKNELEKTMFLSPEERYISEGRNGQGSSDEEETIPGYSGEKTVHGDSNIINASDYLLRINETKMEVWITLYRRFSV